jgi:predicted metal-dependent hydrolase
LALRTIEYGAWKHPHRQLETKRAQTAQRWWLHRRVADVAAIEHFTAVLGEWVIQNKGLEYAGADDNMLDLLRWHGAEEAVPDGT